MTRLFKEMFIVFMAAFAAIYLTFPTFGVIEFIPDFIPIFGSLDEATATLILINTARYYGFDLTNLYSRGNKPKRRRQLPPPSDEV